jgi:hypothetical protein
MKLAFALALLFATPSHAADWFMRFTDVADGPFKSVTSFYPDGMTVTASQDAQGNDLPEEKSQLPRDKTQQYVELASAAQAPGAWKTGALCSSGNPCDQPSKTWVDVHTASGQVLNIIYVDGYHNQLQYRDNPAVLELLKLYREGRPSRRLGDSP